MKPERPKVPDDTYMDPGDGTVWPNPQALGALEWALRYGEPPLRMRLWAASVVAAYRQLLLLDTRERVAEIRRLARSMPIIDTPNQPIARPRRDQLEHDRLQILELRRRVADLEAWNEQLLDDAGMACETPADDCECAGCRYASERAERFGEPSATPADEP